MYVPQISSPMLPNPSSSNYRPTFTDLAQSLKKGKHVTTLSTKYYVGSSKQTTGGSTSWYNSMPVNGALATPAGSSAPTTQHTEQATSNPAQTVPRVTGTTQSSDVNMHSPRHDLPPLPDDSDEEEGNGQQ